MSIIEELNPQQKEAVLCNDTHLRIIAGAGSGKTRVVTTRIAYLIDTCHIWPNQILAITFTNKAAKEMKERVFALLGDIARGIQISTIHSFCVRLLREDIYELGYPRNFTILDSDDQKSILKEAYREYDIDVKSYSYANVLSYISHNKTQFVDPDTAMVMAGTWQSEKIKAQVYEFYQKRLQDMMALDFDDLLLFTHRLLKNYEDIRCKWQRRFQYIHVDEFQDVDNLQYDIIKYLCGDTTLLCVVGDPDQTIYTWRGALVDIIMNFEKDFADCKTVILNENYRSTQAILNGANALISHNENRIEKELFTRNTGDEKIVHFTALDDYNEPVWVASKIRMLHKNGIDFKNIAVLYRSNYLSRSLEKAMLDANLPYRIYGGIRFYDRAEIKDALSYLRLLTQSNEADPKEKFKDLAVRRVINSPRRGVGNKTMEQLEMIAKEHDTNLYEACKLFPGQKGKAAQNIAAFVEMIEACRALRDTVSIDLLLQTVLEKSGYMQMLENEKEIERIENIKELMHDMELFIQNDPEATLDEYMQMITLYTDKEEDTADAQFVSLMTIHAAKGLEFDYVFVYSLCDGIFPNERSVNEGGKAAMEEERRLAYVAFTRAKKQLFLSDAQGYSYMLDRIKSTSGFVKEIPEEYREEVGAKPYTNSYQGVQQIKKQQFGISAQDFLKLQNVRAQAQKQIPVTANQTNSSGQKQGKLHKGDAVVHTAFGEGVIVNIKDGLATVAFEAKFGIRKIMANHPSLSKK